MKTLRYRKISLVIGFCPIFLTPQLFASPGSGETQTSEEVKLESLEKTQPLTDFSNLVVNVEAMLKKPIPFTCSPSSLTGYRTRLSLCAEEDEEYHKILKSIPSNIENLRNMFAALNTKFSLDDVTQKEQQNALRKLININLSILNFIKKTDETKIMSNFPGLNDKIRRSEKEHAVVQTTTETNHLLYSSLHVYANARSRIFGSKSISDSEKINKELDDFYAKVLSEKFTDTLNFKKHFNETDYTDGIKFLKEIVESDPLFIAEYKKILAREKSELPNESDIRTSLSSSEKEFKESEKAVRSQKRSLDSVRSTKADPETLKRHSEKYQELIYEQGSLHAKVRRLERYSERLEEINKTQELLEQLENEIAANEKSKKK